MKKKKSKKGLVVVVLLLLLLGVTVGYSILSTTLNINGTSKISHATWDVHFANVNVTSGSVTPVSAPTITADGFTINYEANLVVPGDFYEFTVDVENDGSVDAKLSDEYPKLSGVSAAQDVYLNYTFLHSDGSAVAANEEILAHGKKTYKVRIEFDRNIENTQLPTAEQNLALKVQMVWEQA